MSRISTREQAARAAARPAATPAANATVTPQRSAEETLDNIVAHIVAQEGISEQAARERVLRDCPDLRAKLCVEANQDRPQRGTRPRPDLADKAAAYGGIPRSGRPVD